MQDWLSVVLEEYRTLRQESLDSIKQQQVTLQAGLAAVAVIAATALNVWADELLAGVALLLFLPFLCYLVLLVWIGEVGRMMRAGRYLTKIEARVNQALKTSEQDSKTSEPCLYWEHWLREVGDAGETNQMKHNYQAVLALFLGAAGAAIGVGVWRLRNDTNLVLRLTLGALELVAFFACLVHLRRLSGGFIDRDSKPVDLADGGGPTSG